MIKLDRNVLRSNSCTWIIIVGLIVFTGIASGCGKKPDVPQESTVPPSTQGTIPQAQEIKTVDIEDPARIVMARRLGNDDGSEVNTEYEIVVRTTDGKNEKVLTRKRFYEFSHNNLVLLEEKNSIFYQGKPDADSANGVWQFDYQAKVDKLLVEEEHGWYVEVSKDKSRLFYNSYSDWYAYHLTTGKISCLYKNDKEDEDCILLDYEGRMVGGCNHDTIFIDDVKTKKRLKWVVTMDSTKRIGIMAFSKSLTNVCYYINSLSGPDSVYWASLSSEKMFEPHFLFTNDSLCGQSVKMLDNRGIYFYRSCAGSTSCWNLKTQQQFDLPPIHGYPFHLIEE